MYGGARSAKRSMYARIFSGPSAQLNPIDAIGKCDTLVQNASIDCAVSVRPPSKIVPETITGTLRPVASKCFEIANRHAFMFSVSNDVSGSSRSTPPSSSP